MELHYFMENREYLTLPAFRTWNRRHSEDTVSDGKEVICFRSLSSVTSTSSGHETNQKEKEGPEQVGREGLGRCFSGRALVNKPDALRIKSKK